MCLHAAFTATHGDRRPGDVETFEGTQHERFALPCGQLADGGLQLLHRLRGLCLFVRAPPGRVRRLRGDVVVVLTGLYRGVDLEVLFLTGVSLAEDNPNAWLEWLVENLEGFRAVRGAPPGPTLPV